MPNRRHRDSIRGPSRARAEHSAAGNAVDASSGAALHSSRTALHAPDSAAAGERTVESSGAAAAESLDPAAAGTPIFAPACERNARNCENRKVTLTGSASGAGSLAHPLVGAFALRSSCDAASAEKHLDRKSSPVVVAGESKPVGADVEKRDRLRRITRQEMLPEVIAAFANRPDHSPSALRARCCLILR